MRFGPFPTKLVPLNMFTHIVKVDTFLLNELQCSAIVTCPVIMARFLKSCLNTCVQENGKSVKTKIVKYTALKNTKNIYVHCKQPGFPGFSALV